MPLAPPETILIPDTTHKRNISSHAAPMQSLGRHDNNSDDDSTSDDGSIYEIDDSTFWEGETFDRVDEESDCEEERIVMGSGWKWDRL
eukprot:7054949-Ditylum_brightwellii.AAC.1